MQTGTTEMQPSKDNSGSTRQVSANLKAAGQLVQKQAQRTKIATIDLPKAHAALGRFVHGLGDAATRFSQHVGVIDGIRKKIAGLSTDQQTKDAGTGFAAKAQGMIKSASDLAQRKVLESQLASAFAKLGEAASSQAIPGAESLQTQVREITSRLAELDGQIASLSAGSSDGGWFTPYRIVIAGVALAVGLCGLFLLSGRESSEDAYYAQKEKEREQEERQEIAAIGKLLADGNTLWDQGRKDLAAQKYSEATEYFERNAVKEKFVVPLGRLIDFLAESGATASASKYAEDAAVGMSIKPLVTTAAGSKALEIGQAAADKYMRDLDERLERDRRERDRTSSQQAESSNNSNSTPSASRFGAPRKDENGLWISGEEAYRRSVDKDAKMFEDFRKKGAWEQ